MFGYPDIESEVWYMIQEKSINIMTEAEIREYE